MPILEDVVALMQSKPNPADLPKSMELFTAGIVDLTQRLRNLEFKNLQQEHRLSLLETSVGECKAAIAAVTSEHTQYKSRVEAVERAPLDIAKKLEEIDKRIRMIEGAVGSTGFKAAKEAPAASASFNPFKATDPVKSGD